MLHRQEYAAAEPAPRVRALAPRGIPCATADARNGFGTVIGVLVAGLAGLWRRRRRDAS